MISRNKLKWLTVYVFYFSLIQLIGFLAILFNVSQIEKENGNKIVYTVSNFKEQIKNANKEEAAFLIGKNTNNGNLFSEYYVGAILSIALLELNSRGQADYQDQYDIFSKYSEKDINDLIQMYLKNSKKNYERLIENKKQSMSCKGLEKLFILCDKIKTKHHSFLIDGLGEYSLEKRILINYYNLENAEIFNKWHKECSAKMAKCNELVRPAVAYYEKNGWSVK